MSPDVEIDCLTVNPKKLKKEQRRRFERKCLEHSPECKNKNFDEMSDEEYDRFKTDCIKENSKFDCSNVNPDDLSLKEVGAGPIDLGKVLSVSVPNLRARVSYRLQRGSEDTEQAEAEEVPEELC